ncbi:HD domain-containing protein [Spirosoma arcticum]
MYTLEKHLLSISNENQQVELLNSIWKLNKKFVPNAQNAISINFPHYSLHDNSHSETIIKNIESLLGEERIKQLSPTDTWLILMSAFTHDLGMVVFYSTLEQNWKEKEFQAYLNDISILSNDKDLQESAILLLDISSNTKSENDYNSNLPLKIRKSVTLIIADYYRKNHHLRSKNILLGKDKEFYDLMNGFNLTGIPNRFSVVLSDIAFAHGIDFYQVIDNLEYISDGYSSDKMHPRFIACLLRIGDLLDVDDKRFNLFQSKVIDENLPETSDNHYQKHSSIKHLLISPKSIEITADCSDDRVYRVARDWFDWLQKEVEDQSKEWSYIAPIELIGIAPTISRGKLKVLFQGSESKRDFMNLRFSISNEKVFEIFEGSAIYQNAEFVFFRELIQNAFDASKIEIWRLVQSGVYDFLIKKHLGMESNTTHQDVINSILFPGDLPNEIWDNFPIELNIDWLDDNKQYVVIKVKDNGTGISDSDLIRMTNKVGQSRSKDKSFQDIKQTMPYWLKPTGAFGIGLQSLFLVTNKFTVRTKTDSEPSKEIIFHSAKNGEYCKVTSSNPPMSRGTEISFTLSKSNFSELFPKSFNNAIVEQFDTFSDKYGEVYFYKIIEFLLQEFKQVNVLEIIISNEKIKKTNSNLDRDHFKSLYNSDKIRTDLYQVTLYRPHLSFHRYSFIVDERIAVGSNFRIAFLDSFTNNKRHPHPGQYYQDQYLVRDIKVDVEFPHYYKLTYCNIMWNLQSPESDKILTISRDGFIRKKQREIDNDFLNNILPKTLSEIINLFESNCKTFDEIIAFQYFHLELTAKMAKIPINSKAEIYGLAVLPEEICTNLDKSPVKLFEFIHSKSILFTHKYKSLLPDTIEKTKDAFGNFHAIENFIADLVLWDNFYFDSYMLLNNFYLKDYKIFKTEEALYSVMIFEENLQKGLPVLCNELSEQEILKGLLENFSDGKRRTSMYPIEKYFKYLSVENSFDEFTPNFRLKPITHYIISPFRNRKEYDDLKLLLFKPDNQKMSDDEVRSFVKNSHLKTLIPENLQDFILKNSLNGNEITNEKILNAYLDLVVDLLNLEIKS